MVMLLEDDDRAPGLFCQDRKDINNERVEPSERGWRRRREVQGKISGNLKVKEKAFFAVRRIEGKELIKRHKSQI